MLTLTTFEMPRMLHKPFTKISTDALQELPEIDGT